MGREMIAEDVLGLNGNATIHASYAGSVITGPDAAAETQRRKADMLELHAARKDLSEHIPIPAPYAWVDQAMCKDISTKEFFPEDGEGVKVIQKVCGGCAVRAECLEYALENRIEHGVWGGASERERKRILRRGRK